MTEIKAERYADAIYGFFDLIENRIRFVEIVKERF